MKLARIAGVDLPRDKRIEIALTYIYGIGRSTAQKILAEAKVDPATKTDKLTEAEITRHPRGRSTSGYKVEGDLRREVSMNIKRLMDLGCYRGLRHRKGLPGARPAHAHQRPHPQGAAALGHRLAQEGSNRT